jgi:zinc transport system substrate-binding protein
MQKAALIGAMLAALLAQNAPARSEPKVVTTILPVHSIAAAVMAGVGAPRLLLPSGASPHAYSLRPSEAEALEQADLIIWIGEGLETFMARPLLALGGKARRVSLADAHGIRLLEIREGGTWDAHDHDGAGAGDDHLEHGREEEENHDQRARAGSGHADAAHEPEQDTDRARAAHDLHLWLAPDNGKVMAFAIARALGELDPLQADLYRSNADRFAATTEQLEADLQRQLAPVGERPFIVFHDAYQYFERAFGLAGAGSVTLSPEVQPGTARLVELRRTIEQRDAVCVFAEPQFEPRLVETLIDGTSARKGILDPLGSTLTPGPQAYHALLQNLGDALVRCLSGGG